MNIVKAFHRTRAAVSRLLRVLRLTLCEIFDEAPYARYLQRAGVSASRESYARFLAEKHHTKAPAARCC